MRSRPADTCCSHQCHRNSLIGTVDAGPGKAVVAVGVIDAVAVRDGHFTPVLKCEDLSGLITLEFADRMRDRVLQILCRRVVVEGRLYVVGANRYRLEVRRLRVVGFPRDSATNR